MTDPKGNIFLYCYIYSTKIKLKTLGRPTLKFLTKNLNLKKNWVFKRQLNSKEMYKKIIHDYI